MIHFVCFCAFWVASCPCEDGFFDGGPERCGPDLPGGSHHPHVSHHWHHHVQRILLQLSHHWGVWTHFSCSRYLQPPSHGLYVRKYSTPEVNTGSRVNQQRISVGQDGCSVIIPISPQQKNLLCSVFIEYFLEDCIQMTNFVSPPMDRKKKDKDEEGGDDDVRWRFPL